MPIGESQPMLQNPSLMNGPLTGELFDLEKLSKACADAGRYTFFFTSWPLNV